MDAKYGAHKKKKTVKDLLEEDYYELLGLTEKRWLSTEDDIKKACTTRIPSLLSFHNSH